MIWTQIGIWLIKSTAVLHKLLTHYISVDGGVLINVNVLAVRIPREIAGWTRTKLPNSWCAPISTGTDPRIRTVYISTAQSNRETSVLHRQRNQQKHIASLSNRSWRPHSEMLKSRCAANYLSTSSSQSSATFFGSLTFYPLLMNSRKKKP